MVYLAEVKQLVMNQLKNSHLLQKLKPGKIFLSAHEAVLFSHPALHPA
jgi:hypothetical protein